MEDDHDHDHEDAEGNVLIPILITVLSGFAACIGALSIFCVKKEQTNLIPISLAFSSGVVIYLLFMNLIPESISQFSASAAAGNEALAHFYTTICTVSGLLIVFATESLFKHFGVNPHGIVTSKNKRKSSTKSPRSITPKAEMEPPKDYKTMQSVTAVTPTASVAEPSSFGDEDELKASTHPTNLKHLSYSIACALIMHHLPEGIATFISLYHDLEFGILVAFALFLHDIPSGICIGLPTYIATGSRVQPFVLCLIAAAAYPIGGCIGWIIVETATEQFAQSFIGALLGITAGIMLHIAFIELLPTAIICANQCASMENQKSVMAISIALLFVGFLAMDISSILLSAVGGHEH